jgi:hypothetical protein
MAQTISDGEIAAAEAESAVVSLSRESRAVIGNRPIANLDEETTVEQAWANEIRRRVTNYRADSAKTRPIDEVLDEVDEILR